MKVVVIGGSIAGLSAGIALRSVGCDVAIYEKSPTILRGRSGGLVVQPEMLDWMVSHGIATLELISVSGIERQFLDQQGCVIHSFPDSTPFTSWDAVFHRLRAAFPDDRYHQGRECTGIADGSDGCFAEFADKERVQGDLVVGADGIGSIVRSHLFPGARPEYAGYVAWRGVIAESLAPPSVVQALQRGFTLYQGADFHILSYMIPGEQGEMEPGLRRLNWVWYWNADEQAELPGLLTDEDGTRHRSSVRAGKMRHGCVEGLRDRAGLLLPPVMGDMVLATPHPFVQVIFDLPCPGMYNSRAVLVGDSACILRPHAAAGTSKASADAVALARHLQVSGFDLDRALPGWQTERMEAAERLVRYGRALARRSGLGMGEGG